MTRKDYILIAEVIATSWHANAEAKRDLAVSMAEALETDNPRFDRKRFLVACGVDSHQCCSHDYESGCACCRSEC